MAHGPIPDKPEEVDVSLEGGRKVGGAKLKRDVRGVMADMKITDPKVAARLLQDHQLAHADALAFNHRRSARPTQ